MRIECFTTEVRCAAYSLIGPQGLPEFCRRVYFTMNPSRICSCRIVHTVVMLPPYVCHDPSAADVRAENEPKSIDEEHFLAPGASGCVLLRYALLLFEVYEGLTRRSRTRTVTSSRGPDP